MKPLTQQALDSYRAAIADAEERLKKLNGEREALRLFVESGKRLLMETDQEGPAGLHTIPSQEFAKLSLVKAAALYLRNIGSPQSTEDLATGLLEAGYKTTSKNLAVLLRPTLYKHIRRMKAAGKPPLVIRLNGESWGLPEWEKQK